MIIEARVDFEANYMDFSDYPDQKNVNANHLTSKFTNDEPYLFAFAFWSPNQITLEKFEDLSFFEKY